MNWVIFETKYMDKVDWSTILPDDPSNLMYSLDGTKCLLNYGGSQPLFVYSVAGDLIGLREYNDDEVRVVLRGRDWIT